MSRTRLFHGRFSDGRITHCSGIVQATGRVTNKMRIHVHTSKTGLKNVSLQTEYLLHGAGPMHAKTSQHHKL